MNFNLVFLRSFRILLFPLALLYGIIIWVRNKLYDNNIIRSSSFNIPIICVGNLTVGGTGKSPMVEYLIDFLKSRYRVGTMSRGYKRRTKGYILADENTTALDIGDEPMQFHLKHPDVAVTVAEERLVAIPQLLYDKPETELIILDDAFQHRAIVAGYNIILTDLGNLYTRDFYLPTGDLRDSRSSAKRADMIVVTKCRPDLTEKEKQNLITEIDPKSNQHVLFSSIKYERPYHIVSNTAQILDINTEVLLVCGIANPEPLKNYIAGHSKTYETIFYSDHQIFRIDDLKEILKRFERMKAKKKIIVTTEKDAVRLEKFHQELKNVPFYVLPIQTDFLFDGKQRFNELITNFITRFSAQKNKEKNEII